MPVIVLVAEEILVELVAMAWDQMPALLAAGMITLLIAVPAFLCLIARIVPAMLLIGLVLPAAMRIVSAGVIRRGGRIAAICRSLQGRGGGALMRRLRPLIAQEKTRCPGVPRCIAALVILGRGLSLAMIIVLMRARLSQRRAARTLIVGLLVAGRLGTIGV
jgi:hypothetical protein